MSSINTVHQVMAAQLVTTLLTDFQTYMADEPMGGEDDLAVMHYNDLADDLRICALIADNKIPEAVTAWRAKDTDVREEFGIWVYQASAEFFRVFWDNPDKWDLTHAVPGKLGHGAF